MNKRSEFKKKWENFWYYYKIHVIAAVFIIICVAIFVKDKTQQIHYDYTVAVLSETDCQADDLDNLQKDFEQIGDDSNGDGTVQVQVLNYVLNQSDTVNPQINMANQTKFLADMQTGISMIFVYSDSIYKAYQEENLFLLEGGKPFRLSDCAGLDHARNTVSLKDMNISLRNYRNSGIDGKKGMDKYFTESEMLLKQFKAAE